jgi:RsmE family RNA methyltransferase
MNLLLFEKDERDGDIVTVKGRRAEHIITILKLGEGGILRVGEINGRMGTAAITAVTEATVRLEVNLEVEPVAGPNIELILALPRPIMLQRIIKQATVMGVRRFYLVRARRVEKSFFQSPVLHPDKIRSLLIEGLEQGVDTRLPSVGIYDKFKPFIEDIVPDINGTGLLAHPGNSKNLAEVFGNTLAEGTKKSYNQTIILAVGAEGGWSEYECERFMEKGFVEFSMGRRVLHVDTAVVALLAQLSLLCDMGI